jgi:hypothetical protein
MKLKKKKSEKDMKIKLKHIMLVFKRGFSSQYLNISKLEYLKAYSALSPFIHWYPNSFRDDESRRC